MRAFRKNLRSARERNSGCSILRMPKASLKEHKKSLKRGCSSAGRAPALQAGGQEFDPPHLHHVSLKQKRKKNKVRLRFCKTIVQLL